MRCDSISLHSQVPRCHEISRSLQHAEIEGLLVGSESTYFKVTKLEIWVFQTHLTFHSYLYRAFNSFNGLISSTAPGKHPPSPAGHFFFRAIFANSWSSRNQPARLNDLPIGKKTGPNKAEHLVYHEHFTINPLGIELHIIPIFCLFMKYPSISSLGDIETG